VQKQSTAPTGEVLGPPQETTEQAIARLTAENAALKASLPLDAIVRPMGWTVELAFSHNEYDETGRATPAVKTVSSVDDPYLPEMTKHGWPGYLTVYRDGKAVRGFTATTQQFIELSAQAAAGQEPAL
jgi:hypothetical protein